MRNRSVLAQRDKRKLAAVLVALAVLTACGSDRRGSDSEPSQRTAVTPASSLVADPSGTAQQDWFVERAEATGLHFAHFNGMSGEFYFPEMMPAGVGLLDYDNDGDLDVYLVQGQMLGEGKTLSQALFQPVGPLPLKGRLYRNDLQVRADGTRTLRFTDVTDASGIDARGYGMGVATGDVDNDGCIDLYLTNLGPNQLFRNNCDGTFTDVSKASGTDDSGWSVSASFLDYDRDGWLDLYVGNYVQYDLKTDQAMHEPDGQPRLLHAGRVPARSRTGCIATMGNGTFHGCHRQGAGRRSVRAGARRRERRLQQRWLDGHLRRQRRSRKPVVDEPAQRHLQEHGAAVGRRAERDGKPEASMGVDAGDFDNDGDEDLFMTHLPVEGNNLYVNDGSGTLRRSSARLRDSVPSVSGYSGFGTAWFDFDNDGWLDILAVNGAIQAAKGRGDDPFPYDERNLLFRNLGDGRFEDVTSAGRRGVQLSEVSRGAAFGDIDNDGDVDVRGRQSQRARPAARQQRRDRHHCVGLRLVGERPSTRRRALAVEGRRRHAGRAGRDPRKGQPRSGAAREPMGAMRRRTTRGCSSVSAIRRSAARPSPLAGRRRRGISRRGHRSVDTLKEGRAVNDDRPSESYARSLRVARPPTAAKASRSASASAMRSAG